MCPTLCKKAKYIGEDGHKNKISIKVVLFIPAKGDNSGRFRL